jgi:hypothetical protein
MDTLERIFNFSSPRAASDASIHDGVHWQNALSTLGLGGLALLATWLLYKTVVYPKFLSPHRNLPGPPASSLLRGNLPEIFAAGPGEIHKGYVRDYGHVVRYRAFLGEDRIFITDPKALNHVLLQHS